MLRRRIAMQLQNLVTIICLLLSTPLPSEAESSRFSHLPFLPCISSVVSNDDYERPTTVTATATAGSLCATTLPTSSTSTNNLVEASCIHRNRNANTFAFIDESESESEGCRNPKLTPHNSPDSQENSSGVKSIEITIPNLVDTDVVGSISIPRKTAQSSSKKNINSNRHMMKNIWNTLISIYLSLLKEHEVLTKSVTSGIIGIIGDFVAQCFEYNTDMDHDSQNLNRVVFSLDWVRLFGIFFESIFVSGPVMHYAYDYMELLVPIHDDNDDDDDNKKELNTHGDLIIEDRRTNSNSFSKWVAASFHVLADIFILGPIFVFTMMLVTSIIEGRIATFSSELTLDYGPALWASTLASFSFVPIQLMAFKCLPIKFRLLYMNLQDVIWNAVVSVMAHKSRK